MFVVVHPPNIVLSEIKRSLEDKDDQQIGITGEFVDKKSKRGLHSSTCYNQN